MMSPLESSRTAPRVRDMVAAALIAALMAAGAWISVPVGAVPITLQTFVVTLAALLLPAEWAAGSMALYVALGAAGVPVFAGGHAGLGVVLGPTGGYLIGFIVGAGAGALVRTGTRKAGARQLEADVAASTALLVLIYAIGTVWLAYSLHMSLGKAALIGAVPFIIGDVIKAGGAILVATAVRKSGVRL